MDCNAASGGCPKSQEEKRTDGHDRHPRHCAADHHAYGAVAVPISDLRGKIIYFVICYIVVLFAAEYLNEALAKIKRPPDDPTRQL